MWLLWELPTLIFPPQKLSLRSALLGTRAEAPLRTSRPKPPELFVHAGSSARNPGERKGRKEELRKVRLWLVLFYFSFKNSLKSSTGFLICDIFLHSFLIWFTLFCLVLILEVRSQALWEWVCCPRPHASHEWEGLVLSPGLCQLQIQGLCPPQLRILLEVLNGKENSSCQEGIIRGAQVCKFWFWGSLSGDPSESSASYQMKVSSTEHFCSTMRGRVWCLWHPKGLAPSAPTHCPAGPWENM